MNLTVKAGTKDSPFMTNERLAQQNANTRTGEQRGKKTIFAGNMRKKPDMIEIKKKQAKEQALKVMTDTFKGEQKLDESVNAMKQQQEQINEDKLSYLSELEEIQKQRARYEETGELEKHPELAKELDEKETLYNNYIESGEKTKMAIVSSLTDISIEREKTHGMVDAAKTSQEILDAANKEIYGELVAESRKHVEEKIQEEKETAEKRSEKKEEQEERLEEARKKKEEMTEHAQPKEEPEIPDTEEILSGDEKTKEIDKKLEEILDEMKLIQDDLKGAAVDQNI